MKDHDRCESVHPMLFDAGIERQCERMAGHLSSWHQYTDSQGRRTQWEWREWERRDWQARVEV